jgi:3-hydroxyisobutyrate dehydrogenase
VSAFALLALAISRLPWLGVPMRMCNLALAEMTEALARGWGGRDSRSVMLLQQERAGVKIAVAPERLSEALAPTISGSR